MFAGHLLGWMVGWMAVLWSHDMIKKVGMWGRDIVRPERRRLNAFPIMFLADFGAVGERAVESSVNKLKSHDSGGIVKRGRGCGRPDDSEWMKSRLFSRIFH